MCCPHQVIILHVVIVMMAIVVRHAFFGLCKKYHLTNFFICLTTRQVLVKQATLKKMDRF
jgi:heterodisulfide reductase subunit C